MPDEDFRLADHARSQAHDSRLKIAGMTRCAGSWPLHAGVFAGWISQDERENRYLMDLRPGRAEAEDRARKKLQAGDRGYQKHATKLGPIEEDRPLP
jgi:hypothetical protein